MTTLSTVGYGDRYPVTSEGRTVAVLLMITGMSLVATMAGLFASWFLGQRQSSNAAELSAVRGELAEIRKLLAARCSDPT